MWAQPQALSPSELLLPVRGLAAPVLGQGLQRELEPELPRGPELVPESAQQSARNSEKGN